MRKISIVQRRLEAGLDLTQAELRALQREAVFEPEQDEPAEETATAVADSIGFMPPMRPPETVSPDTSPADDNQEAELSLTEEFAAPTNSESESSDFMPAESLEASHEERTDSEAFLASIAAGLGDIFPEGGLEAEDVDPEELEYEASGEAEEANWPVGSDWSTEAASDREVLFPNAPAEAPIPTYFPTDNAHFDEGQHPGVSPAPEEVPAKRDETLVLFLVQVPAKSGLTATFSSEESSDSPFAGQLRLRCRADGEGQPAGDVSAFDVNLPPEGVVRLSTGQASNNGHEWALVTLDEKAHAFASFDLRAGRNLSATAAVFNDAPSRKATVPLKLGPSTDRALVLANPTDEPVVVKLSLLDESGQEIASRSIHELNALPAGKQVAIFARKAFQELAGQLSFKGSMVAEVEGKGAIWTAGLSQNEDVLSFLPVAEMEKAASSTDPSIQQQY